MEYLFYSKLQNYCGTFFEVGKQGHFWVLTHSILLARSCMVHACFF